MRNALSVMICILAASLASDCGNRKYDEYAMITFMTGDVKKNNAEAQIGDIIGQNDIIKTGADTSCDMRIGDSVLRMKSMSDLGIPVMLRNNNRQETILELSEGMLLCRHEPASGPDSFFVRTPTVVIAAYGARFTVEVDNYRTTRIIVFKGVVRAAKRIRQLESETGKVLGYAPKVEGGEMVLVKADEVRDAEKAVDKALREETGRTGGNADTVIENVIRKTLKYLIISDGNIEKFKADYFTRENSEIIEVEQKSEDDIKKISMMQRQDRNTPAPEGRLVVTKKDVYLIKEGKIVWTGRIVSEPARRGDRLFIAAGKYVFCAMSDGPVVWKKEIENDGKIRLKNGRIMIQSQGRSLLIDEASGEVR